MTGIIKRIMDRGFGFIESDELDKEVFFHSTEVQGCAFEDLKEGDKVTFEAKEGDKGMNAVNVTKV